MQKPFAAAFKNRNQFSLEDDETPEITKSAKAVRLIIIKKEYAELLDKEVIACMLATDWHQDNFLKDIFIMINAKLKEQAPANLFKASNWARFRLETKADCNENWTEEETHLYECAALSSWESR